MIGSIVVMGPTPTRLALGIAAGQSTVPPAPSFSHPRLRHLPSPNVAGLVPRAPRLEGLFGHQVKLADGAPSSPTRTTSRESI